MLNKLFGSKPSNPKVRQFFVARFINLLFFLNGLFIIVLATKGLSTIQAFKLVSFYSISIVVLEFPTGVIGDYFGHKSSVITGQIAFLIGLFILIIPAINNIILCYLAFFLFALGMALNSGSDVAWLHSISKDFKHDYADYITILITSLFLATITGGFILEHFGTTVVILMTIITDAIGTILLYFVPYTTNPNSKESGNIFDTAKQGLTVTIQNKILLALILFSALVTAFQNNVKYVLNFFATKPDYEIRIIVPIIASIGLLQAIGSQLSKRIKVIKETKFLLIIISIFLLTIATMQLKYLPLLIYSSFGGIGVFLTVSITNKINQQVSDNIRASVLSLRSLITRLIASGYVFLIGYILDAYNFQTLLWIQIAVIVVVGLAYGALTSIEGKQRDFKS